jgi:hypothetical protein
MSATSQRDHACGVAKTDPDRALRLARVIEDPWFRCQALAWAARFGAERRVVPVAREALAAAQGSEDAFRRVAATAWPIRALLERDQSPAALEALAAGIAESRTISNATNRLDALLLLWEAVWPAGREVHRRMLAEALAAAREGWSTKAAGILKTAALYLGEPHPDLARELVAAVPHERWSEVVERAIARGERLYPRSFFW